MPTPENHGEIRQGQLEKCLLCGEGMMACDMIFFYRVSIQQFLVDMRAVQRQHGMEMMMGGAAPLAQIMGADQPMALAPAPANEALICGGCALHSSDGIAHLLSAFEGREPEESTG